MRGWGSLSPAGGVGRTLWSSLLAGWQMRSERGVLMAQNGTGEEGSGARTLVLAAMIFAVSMTFIDQTIVSIAVPQIQRNLGLTSTGVQWVVNAYLLTLAALFAFGGRLADTMGHTKMVVIGVIVFATALGVLRADADREHRRGLDRHLPCAPGRRRGAHVPGGSRDRRPDVSVRTRAAARSRSSSGSRAG